MQGYPIRSVAPDSDAVSIAHSFGHGTSISFFVAAFDARDTETPSRTNAAAALRFAGVMRLRAPISSSFPHRPQFDSSVCQRSNSACVTRGRGPADGDDGFCERAATPVSVAPRMTAHEPIINAFMWFLLQEEKLS